MPEPQSESHSVLPCFKCGRTLKLDSNTETLVDAMSFISHGGWGSQYDPMDSRKFLRIHICDQCVEAEAKKGNVLEGTRAVIKPEVAYEKWKNEA